VPRGFGKNRFFKNLLNKLTKDMFNIKWNDVNITQVYNFK